MRNTSMAIAMLLVCSCVAGCDGRVEESEDYEMQDQRTFFQRFSASELGVTLFVEANPILGYKGDPKKILNLTVDSAGACPVIVSLRSEYEIVNTVSQIGGPIVASVMWGIGGGRNEVEFDVPSGKLAADLAPLPAGTPYNEPMNNLGGGIQVYLGGASHVSISVRNDGNISPLTNPGGDRVGSTTAVKVIAHIEPGTASGLAPVERTIYAVGGNANLPADHLLPLNPINVSVPPLAKSVRFQRIPGNSPIQVLCINNFGMILREVNLGPNDEGPIPIDSSTGKLRIFNQSAADIDYMQAVFNVTPI